MIDKIRWRETGEGKNRNQGDIKMKKEFKAKAKAIIHSTIYCTGHTECDRCCEEIDIKKCKRDLNKCLNLLWKLFEEVPK